MSNSRTSVWDSSVTSPAFDARNASSSLFGGRNVRSQTIAVFGVEERIHRLEPEVGHPDEVGVRERERHAQPAAVRLAYVADLLRQEVAGAFALRPPDACLLRGGAERIAAWNVGTLSPNSSDH